MIDVNDIIELEIKKEWIDEAIKNSDEMGTLKGSITNGDGNQAAFIGEIAVSEYLGYKRTNIHLENDEYDKKKIYHYDMFDKKERKVEVKTKRCSSLPLPEYTTSICNDNIKQECDYYLFTRVSKKHNKVWILGWLEKVDYFSGSTFCIEGEVDPDRGNWYFKRNCWNRYIGELNKISDLENMILKEDHSNWENLLLELRKIVIPKEIESMHKKLDRIQKERDEISKKLSKKKDDWFDEIAKSEEI